MPEVVFYVLGTESLYDRCFFACRLIEKAYRNNQFCYVLLDSPEECQRLDDMLWTFRAGSFIPHQIFTDTFPEMTLQVLLGTVNAPQGWQNVVVNLSSKLPHRWQDVTRVLEIVDNREASKIIGRQRHTAYKQAGATIATHKI